MTRFERHRFSVGFLIAAAAWVTAAGEAKAAPAGPPHPTRTPLVRVVDLNLGETQEVALCDGKKATVKLLDVRETTDSVCNAVRAAHVKVEVNGQPAAMVSATYHLPVTAAGVQIDCPITKGYLRTSRTDPWGLEKDARLRLWPEGSPLIEPGTFVYPVKQRWLASQTQMANEPVFVDGGDIPGPRKIYYHWGLDFGGADRMVDAVSATDGLVVSSGESGLPGYEGTPDSPRYDVVYIVDDQGWYYRYSHLDAIDTAVRPGQKIKKGQRVGILGKEGGSGGWSHLHFDITCRQPSGKWGTQESYAFAWEAYRREYDFKVVAVARPHHLIWSGEKVVLDGTLSWSASGKIARYEWTFTDGSAAAGPKVERTYSEPGCYSEVLKVTDEAGRLDYDFAVVHVIEKSRPKDLPPSIHPTFHPSQGIEAGDAVTFKVRAFRTTHGEEIWDFGDGSPRVTVRSDGNVNTHDKEGYATTVHRFRKPGDYIVRVERSNEQGMKAIGHVHVSVGKE